MRLEIAIADARLQARRAELSRDIIGRKIQAVGRRVAPFQLVGKRYRKDRRAVRKRGSRPRRPAFPAGRRLSAEGFGKVRKDM